jgi:hypothetical protein
MNKLSGLVIFIIGVASVGFILYQKQSNTLDQIPTPIIDVEKLTDVIESEIPFN